MAKRKLTEEHKKNISIGKLKQYSSSWINPMKGRKRPDLIGNTNKKGYKHTEEAKRKIAEASKGRFLSLKGRKILSERMKKNNHFFKNGENRNPYGFGHNYMKVRVLKRDEYKCRLCNSGERIFVHHIDFDKRNNVVENGICLCDKCHGFIHSKKSNNFDWQKKLKRLVNKDTLQP